MRLEYFEIVQLNGIICLNKHIKYHSWIQAEKIISLMIYLLHSIKFPLVANECILILLKNSPLVYGKGQYKWSPLAQYASPPRLNPWDRGPIPHIWNPRRVVGPPNRNLSLILELEIKGFSNPHQSETDNT